MSPAPGHPHGDFSLPTAEPGLIASLPDLSVQELTAQPAAHLSGQVDEVRSAYGIYPDHR
jgi:hypothetical protein